MTKPTHMDVTVSVVFPWATTFDLEARHEPADGETCEACEKATPDEPHTLSQVYRDKASEDPNSWRSLLKLMPGKQATEYVIGPMSASDVASIEDECWASKRQPDGSMTRELVKPSEAMLRTFKASLVNILHGPEPKIVKRGGVSRVDPEWIERNFARGTNRLVAQFVGQVAWAWNKFSEDDEKNS